MKGVTTMRKLLSLMVLSLFTAALAQNVIINPQGIVVNPEPSFEVDVRLNRDGATPSYQIGENISISTTVSADSWVYLFNVRSDGEVVQILPNELDEEGRNNYLRAGQTKTFPPPGARYSFAVSGPTGLDKVIAVASRNQLSTSTLASFTQGEQMLRLATAMTLSRPVGDRKSTRLNSSHVAISYAVFCLTEE